MLQAEWAPYRLFFRFEARTSRQVMTYKDTYFVRVSDSDTPSRIAIGECALFRGLSADDRPDYEELLSQACSNPEQALNSPCSSIRFGFETALGLHGSAASDWQRGLCGIPINGLVWMGDKATMRARIKEKLDSGFRVLKLKIGGIAFDDEVDLLREVRRAFSPDDLEVRLDANGAFTPENALTRLDTLAKFHIHSLEQPVKAGQIEAMARICAESPIPIALDEELIGLRTPEESEQLLSDIRPAYIILKPSLCGGFKASGTYIDAARKLGIGWWATSALESDIGLAAIGSWLSSGFNIDMPQGLGTGQLYTNNIPSPLHMAAGALHYDPTASWGNVDFLPWRR